MLPLNNGIAHEGRACDTGAHCSEVSSQRTYACRTYGGSNLCQNLAREIGRASSSPALANLCLQHPLTVGPLLDKQRRGALKRNPALHNPLPFLRDEWCCYVHCKGEPVEQLGAQKTLFWIHTAEQNELGRVRHAEAFALDHIDSARRSVKQSVTQVSGQ